MTKRHEWQQVNPAELKDVLRYQHDLTNLQYIDDRGEHKVVRILVEIEVTTTKEKPWNE